MKQIVYDTLVGTQRQQKALYISDTLYKYLTSHMVPQVIRYLFEDAIGKRHAAGAETLKLKKDGTVGINYFSVEGCKLGEQPQISYLSNNRVKPDSTHQFLWGTRQRQTMRPVTWVRTIFPDVVLAERLIGDVQMEAFVDSLKAQNAEVEVAKPAFEVRLVTGREIVEWYNKAHYAGTATFYSCLTWTGTYEERKGDSEGMWKGTHECFEACPGAHMALALNNEGKLVARAIVWETDEMYFQETGDTKDAYGYSYSRPVPGKPWEHILGTQYFMDGIYASGEAAKKLLRDYAKDNGYIDSDRYYYSVTLKDGRKGNLRFRVPSGRATAKDVTKLSHYPHFDSLKLSGEDNEYYYYGSSDGWAQMVKEAIQPIVQEAAPFEGLVAVGVDAVEAQA